MKTADRMLCVDCLKTLQDAQLVFKKLPGMEDSTVCAFCHRKRFCSAYRIQYGRER